MGVHGAEVPSPDDDHHRGGAKRAGVSGVTGAVVAAIFPPLPAGDDSPVRTRPSRLEEALVQMRPGNRVAIALLALSIAAVPWSAPRAQAAPARTAPAQAPARMLPERLTDAEFWKFVTDMSEPNGFFRFENFLSNEAGFQTVIPELLRTTQRGTVYLGVGPEQNFTYISALQPKMAIIFDIRRGNLHALMLYKALFGLSANRAEFVSRLFSKPMPRLEPTVTVDSIFNAIWWVASDSALYRRNVAAVKEHLTKTHAFPLSAEDLAGIVYVYDAFYYGGPIIDYSYPRSSNGSSPGYADLMVQNDGRGVQRSFLATEAGFQFMKDMQARNLVIPVVGDFGGPSAIRSVGQYLRDRNATVTAIYASNVEQYLFQSDAWRRYYENLATLPTDSTTTFIRSIGGNAGGRGGYPRLPSVLGSVHELLAAYRAGRIGSYQDVIAMSR